MWLMGTWHAWWFDLLGIIVLALVVPSAVNHSTTPWPVLAVALLLLADGYALVRTRLRFDDERTVTARDYVGVALLIAGVATGSFVASYVSLCLAVVCPLVWFAVGSPRAAIAGNTIAVGAVAATVLVRAGLEGTLGASWFWIVGSGFLIIVFSLTIGLMVHAARKWGAERVELLDDLRTSQRELAESYHELLADPPTSQARQLESPLSARETEVLALISRGYTNRAVALELFISPATVKTHVEHILTKLGATTRTQAVLMAHQEGLLPDVP